MNLHWNIFVVVAMIQTTSLVAFPGLQLANGEDEVNTCQRCHGNATNSGATNGQLAPLLPHKFSMDWRMHEFKSNSRPPVALNQNSHVIRGSTYYDWDRHSMTEIYRDQCIDIFPEGRDFPCQFTSVGSKTFFIKYAKSNHAHVDSCCLWSKDPFWAPRPDVIRNMKFDIVGNTRVAGINWWILDIPMPGPFGYGLQKNGAPSAFWFPVISGWVQQEFMNFKNHAPGAKYFQVPNQCLGEIATCDN